MPAGLRRAPAPAGGPRRGRRRGCSRARRCRPGSGQSSPKTCIDSRVAGRDLQHDRDQVGLHGVPLAEAAVRAGHVEVAQARRGQPVRDARRRRSRGRSRAWSRRRGWSGGSARPRGSAPARARRRWPRWRRTPAAACRAARMASSSRREVTTLPASTAPGRCTDSPTSERAAKCSTPSKPSASTSSAASAEVALDEAAPSGTASRVAGGQVVEHGHVVAGVHQVRGAHAADVAGATGDEQLHGVLLLGVVGAAHRRRRAPPSQWRRRRGRGARRTVQRAAHQHGVRDQRGHRWSVPSDATGTASPNREIAPHLHVVARHHAGDLSSAIRSASTCTCSAIRRTSTGPPPRRANSSRRCRPASSAGGAEMPRPLGVGERAELVQARDRVAVRRDRRVVRAARRACARRPRSSRAPSGRPRRARAPTPARSRRRAAARRAGACASPRWRGRGRASVSSRWRSPATTTSPSRSIRATVWLTVGPALAEPLGDPRAQRNDALLLELVDGAEVHLGGVDEVVHDRAPSSLHHLSGHDPASAL